MASRKSYSQVVMQTAFSAIHSHTKYKVDFALVPVAIILIEFAVFLSQLSDTLDKNLSNLLFLRLTHTLVMLLIAALVSKAYLQLKIKETNYGTLAITGLLVILLGDLLHVYLGSFFGIELINANRRIGIVTVIGALWFPAFIIVAGNRKEIFRRFGEYEKKLFIATRARSRASREFKGLQVEVQRRIREELYSHCSTLKSAVLSATESMDSLVELNKLLAPNLLGKDLRRLSVRLQNYEFEVGGSGSHTSKASSLSIFYQQFRILYTSAIRVSRLPKSTYVFLLLGLTSPLYFYFYSLRETIVVFPLLGLSGYFSASVITTMQQRGSSPSFKTSSILILVTGYFPLLLDCGVGRVHQEEGNHIPLVITLFALPLTYFLFMELFQVLRPTALNLLQGDDLGASTALQNRVSKVVREEFSFNLSHQWAVYIHGKILTRLAATSLKLEVASLSGDREAFQRAVRSLLELLSSPDSDFGSELSNLEAEVNSRLDPWKGLLEINLYIDPDLVSIRNPRVRDLGEVIEELISNSIRHGKAKRIELKVIPSGERDVQVISIDDASTPPPINQGRVGLGSRIFNLASDGRWAITRIGDRTEFHLTMGIEP